MGARSKLSGSDRTHPHGTELLGDADGKKPITVTIYLKTPTDSRVEFEPKRFRACSHLTPSQNGAAYKPAYNLFRDLAARRGFSMHEEFARGYIQLEGRLEQIADLFGTSPGIYTNGITKFLARSGPLFVPEEILPWTRAVLGLDKRPIVQQRLMPLDLKSGSAAPWPTEVAAFYGIPKNLDVKGEGVGIIALGGGYDPNDVDKAIKGMQLHTHPLIEEVPVNGQYNMFQHGTTAADIELALDLQVLAGVIPGGRIVIYFTENTEQGLAAAIQTAVSHPNRPNVLSISWGSPEKSWSDDNIALVQSALQEAADSGVTVVAASGDSLATAKLLDGAVHVLFPASSEHVLACGGTELTLPLGKATSKDETVWNNGENGTDGGVSQLFDLPAYQACVGVPCIFGTDRKGRGVPDIAALAGENPGYRIVLNREENSQEGTSAATPLWAAIIAMANAKRGRSLGSFHRFLYRNPSICRQITSGNNRYNGKGYEATNGQPWNACVGLGVPHMGTVKALAEIS